ncbi:MAG TPA: hypothetical protein VIN03_16690 [Roseateles sp.]
MPSVNGGPSVAASPNVVITSAPNSGSSFLLSASRSADIGDNGGVFELASGVTYTLTNVAPLPAGLTLIGPASGTATLAVSGSATLNGDTASILLGAGQIYRVTARASNPSAYLMPLPPVVTLGLAQGTAQSKNDADANESNSLYTLNIPANTLGASSELQILSTWSLPTGVSVRLRVRFGGVVLDDLTITGNTTLVRIFPMTNRNSQSGQVSNPANAASVNTFSASAVTTSTVDFGTAQQLTVTAQFPVAGSGSNVATLQRIRIVHFYGA